LVPAQSRAAPTAASVHPGRDAPGCALIYASIGVVFWILYAVERRRSKSL